MNSHEEYLELCAASSAGELNGLEKKKLEEHVPSCATCQRALRDYENVFQHGLPRLASEFELDSEEPDGSWSVQKAERAFFQRLEGEQGTVGSRRTEHGPSRETGAGGRFIYRPSQIRWLEIWMPLAASVILALALGIAAYRSGIKRGTDVARPTPSPLKDSSVSLEEQVSDAGHERAQLVAKLAEEDGIIADLRRQLVGQLKEIKQLKIAGGTLSPAVPSAQQPDRAVSDAAGKPDGEQEAAKTKLQELQSTIDTLMVQRESLASRTNTLEAKVGELTQLVRDREQALNLKDGDVAKQQELLDHDRDIRELMGARDLYIAEVHDVSRTGQTDKTYGRVFYTKGKSLIFYAYDLDAQPRLRNVNSFQAWGRRGPDKEQALNLGIFYEDNVSKRRWVLEADDPKTLADIDAVFVTVEPNGGSQHPSGKQLLFAYLRVSPNHP
jgi:hypothetical protein